MVPSKKIKMDDAEGFFILFDRIDALRKALKNKEGVVALSFSGGRNSTVLHYLIDEALPENKITRVFINTGIEHKLTRSFVENLAKTDPRIVIIRPTLAGTIGQMLENVGYPYKSKGHSKNVHTFQNSGMTRTNIQYTGRGTKVDFTCPKCLLYQFEESFKIPISARCCDELKKKPYHAWARANGVKLTITGMGKEEGGQRNNLRCFTHNKTVFNPLAKASDAWQDWYIKQRKIRLNDLYYEPYNFERTGCMGCPYNPDIREQLAKMERLLPGERAVCEKIWKPVYDEMRRTGYRLDRIKTDTESEVKK